jgi:hypothetical protein
VSYGSIENCPGRNPFRRARTEVRAAIVVKKRGNACGAKGGRKVERQSHEPRVILTSSDTGSKEAGGED